MASEKSRLETFGIVLRDVVTALRDSVLFFLFLLLLFAPNLIRERLVEAGFTKGSIAGLEWEAQIKSATEQTKAAGQTVVQASETYDQLLERIGELESRITDPSLKSAVQTIESVATSSRAELATADRALKRSLAAQQSIADQVSPSSIDESGWIYVGKVSEDRREWAAGSPQTIGTIDAVELAAGARLTIRDDVYLRGDGPSNARSSAPVRGLAKVGDTVVVNAVDYSHAKGGGWFVWASVRRE